MDKAKIIPNNIFFSMVEDKIAEGKSVIIPVKGYSMDPFIRNGRDSVELFPIDCINVGDIVLAHLENGNYVLHRVIDIKGEKITLMGDGNIIGVEKTTRGRIIGIVARIIKGDKSVDCSSECYIRKVRIWGKLLPVRRYILAIYRRLVY